MSNLRDDRSRNGPEGEAFKAAMCRLASGVILVTTEVDGRAWGVTITSCSSVSAVPPRVLISLGSAIVSCRAILQTGRFGVSLLSSEQKRVAEVGARAGEEKFVDAYCCEAASRDVGSAMIRGALAHLDCTLERAVEVGDHTLIVGDVTAVVPNGQAEAARRAPLLYFDRAYHRLGDRAQ